MVHRESTSMCSLNRLRVLQRQTMSSHSPHQAPSVSLVSTSPCHYMTVRLVSSIDQGIAAETPVYRAPPTVVSVIDNPSDATATPVSCMDQDSVLATDCNSVSGAGFSGEQVLELWPSERPTVALPTAARLRNHHKRRLTNVPAHAGITCQQFQQPYPRTPVMKPIPAAILSSQQKSDGLNETCGDPGRGTTSRRRVLSTARSASPGCWTFGELLVIRDVSMPAGTPCPAFFGYQQILGHFLIWVAERTLLILNDTPMTASLTVHCNAHYMSGVQHYLGNTLMVAVIARMPPVLFTREGHTHCGKKIAKLIMFELMLAIS